MASNKDSLILHPSGGHDDLRSAIAPHTDLLAGDGIHPHAGGGTIYSGAVATTLAAAAG